MTESPTNSQRHNRPEEDNRKVCYDFGHIYKHAINGLMGIHASESKQPGIHAVTAEFLWNHKNHPQYFGRPNETQRSLAEILDMLEEPVEQYDLFNKEPPQGNFYQYADFLKAALPQFEIAIPDAKTLVHPGLLTDAIRQSTDELKTDIIINEYAVLIAERRGLSLDEAKRHFIANGSYNLFLAASVLPHIAEGTESQEYMKLFFGQNAVSKKIDGYRDCLNALLSR